MALCYLFIISQIREGHIEAKSTKASLIVTDNITSLEGNNKCTFEGTCSFTRHCEHMVRNRF